MAALGSSFAAGPGIEPVVDKAARRSGRNYAHLVAQRLGAELVDLTVSGATTETILDKSQRVFGRTFAPQISGVPSDADLVTVTVGGNDLRYGGTMIRLGAAGRLEERALTRPLGALLRRPVPDPTVADIDRVVDAVVRVVRTVREKATGARVLLVDYLTMIGPHTAPRRETPFDDATLAALRRLGERVTEVFATAAARSEAELVHAGERSLDHAIGSKDPWVLGLADRWRDMGRSIPFHPNAAGMAAVADMIMEQLDADPQ
ncbi:SGNH/GDSL hydrolase family protein [Nocardia panacis]|uniref:SGNH/GDSL hydrolase family protein n=2 Tax=Nocardia panacis TaxID=2340916 RepID=A0A3A4KLG5_9NOCA|nr:SGNH/GDSL hydrolase family protein [Nocardia panacis]